LFGVLAFGGTWMNTSILTVVLTGALLAGQNGNQTWQNDYSKAQQQASAQRKPLAVVFGSGPDGWTKVVREAPNAEVKKLLTEKYVCVYIDTASPAGQKLAQQFDITTGIGLVISDHSGTSQAFWHQGDVTNESMASYLKKYADPSISIQRTETANSLRTSYYPALNNSQGFSRSSASC
jgi:hypothetical protein